MKRIIETTIIRELYSSHDNMTVTGEIEIDVVANYYDSQPATGPSYSSGGTPEEPASVEIESASHGKEQIELTTEEEQQVIQYCLENPPCND